MRNLLLALLLLSSVASSAQNGGQYPENNSVKLTFIGGLQTMVTNKQACAVTLRIRYNGITTDVPVLAGASHVVSTPVPGKIEARTTTNCGNADYGWVELILDQITLPVKFVSLSVTPLPNKMGLVTFEIAEATNVKQFNIQISRDGINYQTIGIMFPDEVQPNRVYQMKVSLDRLK